MVYKRPRRVVIEWAKLPAVHRGMRLMAVVRATEKTYRLHAEAAALYCPPEATALWKAGSMGAGAGSPWARMHWLAWFALALDGPILPGDDDATTRYRIAWTLDNLLCLMLEDESNG